MNIEREKAEKLGLSLSMVSGGYIVHCPSGNRRIDSLIEVHALARGEFDGDDPAGKIAKSKETGVFKFGVAMDDKLLTIETKWADIETMTVEQMTDMIIDAMRQNPDDDL
jgi:hypothetical protein